jgi:RimJ/RimL family protein N-acetyltransferase
MEFYPTSAAMPEEKRTARLLLRPLRATDAELDYEAVISSAEQLRRWSPSDWPADDLTLEQNRDDLQRHEQEHDERKAFRFTILNPDATRCLGCVYIVPLWRQTVHLCVDAAHAALVAFWVRASEVANDLDRDVLAAVRDWIKSEWAFDCVVYITSQHEERQASLLREAGLERRAAFTLGNGRSHWTFS